MDEDIDIELRSASEVARRAIVLSTVLQRTALEESSTEEDTELLGEIFDLREWLRTEHLDVEVSAKEAEILGLPLGTVAREDRTELSWQTEALAVLLWSLGAQPPAQQRFAAEPAALFEVLPRPWDSVDEFVGAATLIAESEIAREREAIDVWHWRATAEALRREASGIERQSYELAIRDVLAEASVAGYLESRRQGDFTFGGRPVPELSEHELSELTAATAERLRALNWICGFGSTWDDVPLDV
jgi:Domain of unknown function (DUF4272)